MLDWLVEDKLRRRRGRRRSSRKSAATTAARCIRSSIVAEQKWKSGAAASCCTLESLVEWLAGKLGMPYLHIDPLKIDFGAVTATMSNAYAERFRILPVGVDRARKLTVATASRSCATGSDELAQILKLEIKLVFANPVDIERYLGEFFNLARR